MTRLKNLWTIVIICIILGVSIHVTGNRNEHLLLSEPDLAWKVRAYGNVKEVAISPDGNFVVARVYVGISSYKLQCYDSEGRLMWKQKFDPFSFLHGFTLDSKYILVQKMDLSLGHTLLTYDLSGKIVRSVPMIISGGRFLYGCTVAGTNYEAGDFAISDNGCFVVTDRGKSKFHDRGICFFDAQGSLLWRKTLEYPLEFGNVWISHDSELVLARTLFGEDSLLYLFDTTGNVCAIVDETSVSNKLGRFGGLTEYSVAFSPDNSIIAFVCKWSGKIILFNTQLEQLSKINLEYKNFYDTLYMDFCTYETLVTAQTYMVKSDNIHVVIIVGLDGVIQRAFPISKDDFLSIAIDTTPDGKYIVMGSESTYIYKFGGTQ